jgi:argininosuccinate lyase
MPHKKNRMFWIDSWKMQQDSSFAIITLITNNLPSGYHRDLIAERSYFQQFKTWKPLDIAIFSIKDIKVKNNILADKIRLLIYCRLIEWGSSGIPFRDAYKAVAEQLEHGTFQSPKKPNTLMKEVLIICV